MPRAVAGIADFPRADLLGLDLQLLTGSVEPYPTSVGFGGAWVEVTEYTEPELRLAWAERGAELVARCAAGGQSLPWAAGVFGDPSSGP